MSYAPHSEKEIQELLNSLGFNTLDELFGSIPGEFLKNTTLTLPEPATEKEVLQLAEEKSSKLFSGKSYCGYGYYDHHIPVVVSHLGSLRQFVTSYTPYQPEVAQGILQALFEYQSQMALLTSLPIANASLYDAPTALTEVVRMVLRTDAAKTDEPVFLLSEGIHPAAREVLQTYFAGDQSGIQFIEVPLNKKTGSTDWESVKSEKPSAVLFQNPTFFGTMELELDKLKDLFPDATIAYGNMDPHFLTLLPAASECGASIVWGEAQALGNPVSFGGPSLGFLAADEKYMRQIPGRLVGKTSDKNNRDAYVITLSTREQHIRRDKATSNICSNQTLIAIRSSIYMASLGWEGMREVAEKCLEKTSAFIEQLNSAGIKLLFPEAVWMNEVSYVLPDPQFTREEMKTRNVVPGVFYGPDSMITYLSEDTDPNEFQVLISMIKGK